MSQPHPGFTSNRYLPLGIFFVAISILITAALVTGLSHITPSLPAQAVTNPPLIAEQYYQAELPADFPEFPQFPQSQIKESYRLEENHHLGFGAEWETSQDLNTVTDYFLTQLPASGWTITIYPPDSPNAVERPLRAIKDSHTAYLTIEKEASSTIIELEIPYQITP